MERLPNRNLEGGMDAMLPLPKNDYVPPVSPAPAANQPQERNESILTQQLPVTNLPLQREQQSQRQQLLQIQQDAPVLAPAPTNVNAAAVTPDEVVTLGALALAGLWPGTWCGIAAIIVRQVEILSQRGTADLPFRRCARSLVDMLLRSPGEPSVAVETWQHLASAQARLPDNLSQALGLACSLLQGRTMEAADVRARKKRRRSCSADAVASVSARPPPLTPPCATALVVMVNDIGREEEQKLERENAEAAAAAVAAEREEDRVDVEGGSLIPSQQLLPPAGPPANASPLHEPLPQHMLLDSPNFLPIPPSVQIPPVAVPGIVQNGAGWAAAGAVGGGPAISHSSPPPLPPPSASPLRQPDWNLGAGQTGYYPVRGATLPAQVSPAHLAPAPARQVDGGGGTSQQRVLTFADYLEATGSSVP